MGREGQQAEYDIYPRGLTEPWDARRFGVGEALYASPGITREDKRGRIAQFMHNYTGFGAPVMLFLHCSRGMGPPQWADMGMWLVRKSIVKGKCVLDRGDNGGRRVI